MVALRGLDQQGRWLVRSNPCMQLPSGSCTHPGPCPVQFKCKLTVVHCKGELVNEVYRRRTVTASRTCKRKIQNVEGCNVACVFGCIWLSTHSEGVEDGHWSMATACARRCAHCSSIGYLRVWVIVPLGQAQSRRSPAL